MLQIRNGYVEYDTSHLVSDEILTYEQTIERLDKIEPKLFYNIVSSPDCRYEKYSGFGRIKSEFKEMNALDRFYNIIKTKKLFSNPKGYFVNKPNDEIQSKEIEDIKSVSFTLASIDELPEHFKARGSDFGFCFNHDFLLNNGITPVQYLNKNDNTFNAKLIFNSPHLAEINNVGKYDMKWENEWRIKGDLDFEICDIAFVIVPKEKYNEVLNWSVEEGYEFPIITSLPYKSHLEHLFFIPKMENGWNQIRYCASLNDNGFKMDPLEIERFSEEELRKFEEIHQKDLRCLVKNTILDCYELRFIRKFSRFLNKVKLQSLNGELLSKFTRYIANSNEPFLAESTLVNNLYTELFILDNKRK